MKAILLFAITILLFSCSDDEFNSTKKSILIEKENSLTAQEKIRELLLKTEGDYEQLACIFNNSPSSTKRLKNGETFATPEAEIEINKHYNYFIVKENSIDDFKADCISYKWYNHTKSFMSNWWFWGVFVILIIISFATLDMDGNELLIIFLVLLFYAVVWLLNYFGGEPVFSGVPDNFINTLDTVWESKI